jgi:hypothetical protein
MVNVDTVYQRVLALANKEQRGYITPQEFNLHANQAQMSIFEQYFYDLNQFRRLPGNNSLHSDMVDVLEEKINIFHSSSALSAINNTNINIFDLNQLGNPSPLYRLMQVRYDHPPLGVEVEKVEHREFMNRRGTSLMNPSFTRPVYYLKGSRIIIAPRNITAPVSVNFVRKPHVVKWGYIVVDGTALYSSGASSNFELHASEETDLVIKILGLAGITLKDPSVYQTAMAEDNKNIQQEKR